MAFAKLNGVVLHHRLSGNRAGPCLVFANSLGTDFRIWDDVATALEERCLLLRYDKRGHGLSDAPPAPYSMVDHVDDLAALLDHCGIGRATIVGLSVGGMIAQGLAARRPDLVEALVLCGTAPKIGTAEIWDQRIATARGEGIAAMADAIMERWFTPAFRDPANAALAGYRNMLVRTPVEGYAGTCAAIRDADLTESTAALAPPVLCLVGDQDGSTPPDLVRAMADTIDDARFELIRGAGHIPCVEQPQEMVRLILRFLDETGAFTTGRHS
jgi:3-oxoadipate enol-lactonase